MVTSKELTIVVCREFDGRLCGRGAYTVELVYYFPTNKELQGKTVSRNDIIGKNGIYICNKGENEKWLTTNNLNENKLRNLLPRMKGAVLLSHELVPDYKDDPNGRRVQCGTINRQKWDISKILSDE